MEFYFPLFMSLGKTKEYFIFSFTDIPSGLDLPFLQIYVDSLKCTLSSFIYLPSCYCLNLSLGDTIWEVLLYLAQYFSNSFIHDP